MPLSIMAEPALADVHVSETDWPGKMLAGLAVMLTVGMGFALEALRPTQLDNIATERQATAEMRKRKIAERIVGVSPSMRRGNYGVMLLA